jgi:PBSX family phage portal protein
MAVKQRRKITVAKNTKTPRNEHAQFVGGVSADVIGHTKDVAGLTSLERMSKGVYGIFDDRNPHYSVVYGDIMTENQLRIVEPVYPFRELLKVFHSSTILRQCVDSYVTNIESYGVELEYVGPEGQQESRAALNEKARIERLIATLTTDGRPLKKHREDSRVDKEVLGARCFEIIQDAMGRVVHMDHVETTTIRMTAKEKDYTEVYVTDYKTGARKMVRRRFRRFVQVLEDGRRIWFKEFGDPRKVNPATGKVDNSLSIEDEATSIYYDALYAPGTPCGMPRWAGAIPALLGSREAEMVNLNFFRDNAIPAMAVLVSGGALTEESFNKIDSYIQGVRGAASMNRIVVMEATAEGSDAASIDGSLPAPKVDLKPMLSERQHEGLFKNYIEESERKARSSFRLPPIYIGSASEYNRASAFASVLTADQQIFVPERVAWDTMFENVVLSTHNIRYWRVRSTGPGLQDPQEVARIVNSLGREGALTPNIAIKIANRYLDADIQPVMDEWGDLPFNIIMEYVKDGKVIEGLDIFEEQLDTALPEVPESTNETGEDALDQQQIEQASTVKVVRRLLDEVSDRLSKRLEEAVQDHLQSIAAE